MRHGVRAGLIAAVLGLSGFAPNSFVIVANDGIDQTVTGSIGNDAATVENTKGSVSFQKALGVLTGGDPAAAYQLARGLTDVAERRAVQWAAIYFNPGKVDYETIQRFAADAPAFAASSIYRTRMEQALTAAEPPGATVIATLGGAAPNTIDAQIMLATSYLAAGQKDRATALAKSIWVDNFLSVEQEADVLAKLGTPLDREAHWARAMHLMMHDRAQASERLIPYLSAAQKSLVVARAAVSRNDADAKKQLDSVDSAMQTNPVFIFSRAQRARQFELWESAVDWLNKAPDELPDAAEWWYERRALVRQLLNQGQPKLAYQAAAGYTKGPEGRLVDAQFHAGWIALSFLDDAAAAKKHFIEQAKHSTLPDTVSQANYWLGRANQRLGDAASAKIAFTKAARYGNVYYGQLARAELGQAGVDIRPLPAWQQSATLFNGNEMVRAIRLLAANGQKGMAIPLLRHYSNGLKTGGELLLAARLAQEIGASNVAISIADAADRLGIPLDLFSFPKDGLPDDAKLAADRAAVYAITRQESMFQIDAVSPAGARGLMQLMPGTAKEVAGKVGVDYSPSRLVSDPSYNALLGSTYLATQLQRYTGSLVLAAAAYNAGPGNANKWLAAYGDPRADNVDPVIWVELIPFQETRKYVQRVLGNYLVYRERLGNGGGTLLEALRTIE